MSNRDRSRDPRARAKARSGFKDHEQYALLPREILSSAAYRALPDYATRVLAILASNCRKTNNGDMSLTLDEARSCGVKAKWKLYAALELLQIVGLVIKTRQGGMRPMGPTLYALGWWPIADSDKYDIGVRATLDPPNGWASWVLPSDWSLIVREVEDRQRGNGSRKRARQRVAARSSTGNGETGPNHGPPGRDSSSPRSRDRSCPQRPPASGNEDVLCRPPGGGDLLDLGVGAPLAAEAAGRDGAAETAANAGAGAAAREAAEPSRAYAP